MKDITICAVLAITAGLMFLFNPVQETEIHAKISQLCSAHRDLTCSAIADYCLPSLQVGQECYLINQK